MRWLRYFLLGLAFLTLGSAYAQNTAGTGSAYVMTNPWLLPSKGYVDEGDSLMAGNVAGSGNQIWSILSAYTTGASITNLAVGGTTSAQILTAMQAMTATQKAGLVVFNGCRNDINSVGYPNCVSNMEAAGALLTGPFMYSGMPTATTDPLGTFNWAQVTAANRTLLAYYGVNYYSMWRKLQSLAITDAGDPGYAADQAALAIDETPPSVRTLPNGSVDSLHYGARGSWGFAPKYQGLAYDFGVWTQAVLRGDGFIQPWQEFHLTGAAATAAQTNGGAVVTAPCIGTIASASITLENGGAPSGNFAIDSSCRITRATATVITTWRIDLTVQIVTRNGVARTGVVRLYIGSPGTGPTYVAVTSSWETQPQVPSGIDAQQISGFDCYATGAGTDGQDMYLHGMQTPNAKFIEHRTTGNREVIIGKNSSNTTVYSLQTASSGAGLITAASGQVCVFFAMDLTAGTPSTTARVYVNETSSLSFLTGTSGETVNLAGGYHFMLAQTVGATTGVPTLPFVGSIGEIWLGAGYIDWSNIVNRALVYNTVTHALNDLGATGSITPFGGSAIVPLFYLRGNAADWGWGNNAGTAGQMMTATSSGASIN